MSEQVLKIIADQLGHKHRQVEFRHTLVDDLGADSLDVVELCMEIEDAFGIHINDEECDAWQTVQDVVDTVEKAHATT